jgi:hypothetical protein
MGKMQSFRLLKRAVHREPLGYRLYAQLLHLLNVRPLVQTERGRIREVRDRFKFISYKRYIQLHACSFV